MYLAGCILSNENVSGQLLRNPQGILKCFEEKLHGKIKKIVIKADYLFKKI